MGKRLTERLTTRHGGVAVIRDKTRIKEAMERLARYEETGLSPEEVEKRKWIPANKPPKTNDYILLSFENFSELMIGRYEEERKGGAYYLGNTDETALDLDLYVNAWQPLPDPYKEAIYETT